MTLKKIPGKARPRFWFSDRLHRKWESGHLDPTCLWQIPWHVRCHCSRWPSRTLCLWDPRDCCSRNRDLKPTVLQFIQTVLKTKSMRSFTKIVENFTSFVLRFRDGDASSESVQVKHASPQQTDYSSSHDENSVAYGNRVYDVPGMGQARKRLDQGCLVHPESIRQQVHLDHQKKTRYLCDA